jgi:hypothetical protein
VTSADIEVIRVYEPDDDAMRHLLRLLHERDERPAPAERIAENAEGCDGSERAPRS